MSDGLDIRHGGVIAVDTEALREVARRLDGVAAQVSEARAAVGRAQATVLEHSGFDARVDVVAMMAGGDRLATVRDELEDASASTMLMADVYEVVELRAEVEALRLIGAAPADVVQVELDRLLASDERLGDLADRLTDEWKESRFEGLDRQFDLGGGSAFISMAAAAVAVLSGLGTVRPGATLRGTPDAVAVTEVRSRTLKAPPQGVAGALRRFPTTPGAQVRVDRYTMPDGTRHFIAAVTGTQTMAFGGSEPWDMRSNAQLYSGETSASYQATLDALAAAGAQPGERVDIVAHSQGGMIAAHLAMESGYDVRVQLTAGSPVEPALDDDQLLIQLRHTDDVVSSLAGGGSPAGTGSPDSFTAERVGDPIIGLQDLMLAPHQMDAYLETAEMVDESGDPRLEALDEQWAELDDAVEITSTEYRAERTG